MICFARSSTSICCIRIQVHAKRNIIIYTALDIFQPLFIILIALIHSVTTTNDYIINARSFNFCPIYVPVMVANINTFIGICTRIITVVEFIKPVEHLISSGIFNHSKRHDSRIQICSIRICAFATCNYLTIAITPAIFCIWISIRFQILHILFFYSFFRN